MKKQRIMSMLGMYFYFAFTSLNAQTKISEEKYVVRSRINVQVKLKSVHVWPGEELLAKLRLENKTSESLQLPDLLDPQDGNFQSIPLFGRDFQWRHYPTSYLLKPKYRIDKQTQVQWIQPNEVVEPTSKQKLLMVGTAGTDVGVYVLSHSFLGQMLKYEVVSPVVTSISEADWPEGKFINKKGQSEKRYLRIFSLEDDERSSICYTNRPTKSLDESRVPEIFIRGEKMPLVLARSLESYRCIDGQPRSIDRLEATVDPDGKFFVVIYAQGQSPSKLVIERD